MFVVAGVALALEISPDSQLEPEFWAWPTPLLILLGLAGADLLSGIGHWAGDTWGTERTPVVGWRFIRPFRFHHVHPLDMLKSHFFATNGDNVLVAIPLLLLPLAVPLEPVAWLRVAVVAWAVGAFGMWTGQFHLWAHMKRPPLVARLLQRCRLILTPAPPPAAPQVAVRGQLLHHDWLVRSGAGPHPVLPRAGWAVSKLTGLRPRPAARLRHSRSGERLILIESRAATGSFSTPSHTLE